MNFRDAYKSYNSEIKANPEILETVLSAQSKPRRISVYRPVLAFAAMLALVVSVSVFSYNTFYKEKEPEVSYIASNDTADKTEHNIQRNITGNDSANETVAEIVEQKDVNYAVAPFQNTVSQSHTKKADVSAGASETEVSGADVSAPALYDDSSDVIYSDVNDGIMVASLEPDNQAMPALEPDAGVPAALCADDALQLSDAGDALAEYMSYDEYTQYTGLDINSKAKLPDDMIFEPMPSAEVTYEGDKLVSDTFTASAFSVENPNRSITLSLTKSGVQKAYTDDISYTCDNAETVTGAHTVVNGVSVSLDANNVTKEEIDAIINSLK